MTAQIVTLHVTQSAKARGIAVLARIRGIAAGLSLIQTDALARYARNRYLIDHASPARAVADAAARARELAREASA